tara:strand:- start:1360 stop:3333 length:1974 start_codon:yes stop_codon:yes gene_type:complete
VAQANVKLTVDATSATRALSNVQRSTNTLQKSFGGLKTAIAGVGLTILARQAVNTAANFNKLNIRLKLLTKESGTFARSQKIAAEAQKTFGLSAVEALEGITDITARLAPLGVAVEDIKSTFVGFNTAAKLSGASTIEASNAFRQLAQALGSGRLAGDEFRSISEQIPLLNVAIAKSLQVPVGALKEMAANGELTKDVVIQALRDIEREGGESLAALVRQDPTQVFKNLTNATEDLSRAIGTKLNPVVLPAVRALTKLTESVVAFVNSPIGATTAIFLGVAAAVKALTTAVTLLSAAKTILIAKFVATKVGAIAFAKASATASLATKALAISTGALAVALNALPLVALATLLGVATTAIIKHRKEQKKFNDVVKEGSEKEVNEMLKKQLKIRESIEKKLKNSNGRKKESVQRTLDEINANIDLLEARNKILEKDKEINAEQKKRNEQLEEGKKRIKEQEEAAEKLKERFMEIGKSVEEGIVQNLTDAVMGTKTLAEAAVNVLNELKRKLIELAIQRAVAGIGNFIGNALGLLGGYSTMGGKTNVKMSTTQLVAKDTARYGTTFPAGSFANGGRPPVGKASLVGERGPEMFVPSRSGTIIPNSSLGGKSVTNNIVVNVDASGTAVQGNDAEANQFGETLAAAIQAELINQQRTGGLLA